MTSRIHSRLLRCVFVFGLLGLLGELHAEEIQSIGRGPFAVGCTHLAVSAPEGEPMIEFLNGTFTRKETHYLTDILVDPAAVPTVQVDVPSDKKLFGSQAGTRLPVVLLVVYPTTEDNPRVDYTFPYSETGDNVLPRMQQAGDKPLFADTGAKYPLIAYSGGFNTHGLWHLETLKHLASHGYIVVDVFHGDSRSYGYNAAMALRPLALQAAIEHLLQDPEFSKAIDVNSIGLSGASAGGHTIMTLAGGVNPKANLTPRRDPRIKAVFGVVPYFGGNLGRWPVTIKDWRFGEDHSGLRTVSVPFMAVYGSDDSNVPPEGVLNAARAVSGPSWLVKLEGETHSLTPAAQMDVHTWQLLFFNAQLRDDPEARRTLATATRVLGGVADTKSALVK